MHIKYPKKQKLGFSDGNTGNIYNDKKNMPLVYPRNFFSHHQTKDNHFFCGPS